ncbi:MAG: hypothetical protein ACLUEC_09770 [Coprococcus sp.]
MSLEVTINVPGLKELSEALMQLASAMGGKSAQVAGVAIGQVVHEQQSAEEVPLGNASSSQQNAPVTVPTPAASDQTPAQPVQTPITVPTSEPTYTREDLSRAAMQLMDKGMQAQLMQLIQSFGVASLMELSPEHYGNFATGLRGMGAQI